jgi:hypothetical protein
MTVTSGVRPKTRSLRYQVGAIANKEEEDSWYGMVWYGSLPRRPCFVYNVLLRMQFCCGCFRFSRVSVLCPYHLRCLP